MAQHKWYNEIVAWANGAEIEIRFYDEQSYEYSSWVLDKTFNWDILNAEYRIKPQPFAKCIVKDCMNHTNEGSFVGELCAPCWDYITNGNGVHSQAYRNAQPKEDVGEKLSKQIKSMLNQIEEFISKNENTKPQPKEPQYLYAYEDLQWDLYSYKLCRRKGDFGTYIGKIKLEDEDV